MHLLSCKSCARQYDVTHLEIDETVHCQCETVLVVPPQRKLVAGALLCAHCSGPVGPDDEACPYCTAAISEVDRRETTLCPECFARISSSARHCGGCGVRIQPTALRPMPQGRACPRCEGTLRHRALGQINLIECGDCRGLWVSTTVFAELCRTAMHAAGPLPAPALPDETESTGSERAARVTDELRYLPCVDCGEFMARRQFSHRGMSSGIVIDACRLHGVWLDDSELARVSAFLRTADTAQLFPEPKAVASRSTERIMSEVLAEHRPGGARGFAQLAGEALVETVALVGRLLSQRL